jgi:hypothetical protein
MNLTKDLKVSFAPLSLLVVSLTINSLSFSSSALARPRIEIPPASKALLLSGKPSQGASGSFETAMKAALEGPEKKKLKIFGHEFNIKPVEIMRNKGEITVVGQMSHHLKWRRDDQVYYRITKKGDTVKDIQVNIDRGGFAPVAAPIVSALGAYVSGGSITVPPNKVEQVGRSLGKAVDGSWEQAAQFLIVNIALRANGNPKAVLPQSQKIRVQKSIQ